MFLFFPFWFSFTLPNCPFLAWKAAEGAVLRPFSNTVALIHSGASVAVENQIMCLDYTQYATLALQEIWNLSVLLKLNGVDFWLKPFF